MYVIYDGYFILVQKSLFLLYVLEFTSRLGYPKAIYSESLQVNKTTGKESSSCKGGLLDLSGGW